MHVGLVNLYACGNAGDEAILRCIVRRLREEGLATRITSIAVGPPGALATELPGALDPMGRAPPLEAIFRGTPFNRAIDWRRLLLGGDALAAGRAVAATDLLLWAGGYCLHDRRPGVMATVAFLAAHVRRDARHGFYAIGAGPLTTPVGRLLARRVVDRAAFVSVRDAGSADVLRAAGARTPATVTVDPAVELASCAPERARALVSAAGIAPDAPFVAVAPCAWHSMDEYYTRPDAAVARVEAALATLARRALARGLQVLFVPTMWPEDGALAARVCATLARDRVGMLATQLPAPEIQGVVARGAALVTMRLHPAIFALNTATPLVAVAYDRKVPALLSQLGCADACVPLDALSGEVLAARLDDALAGRIAPRERLLAAHARQLDAARATGVALRRAL